VCVEHVDTEIAANLDNICNNIRLCLQLTHVQLVRLHEEGASGVSTKL
jgi:hypothetical protein